MTAFSCEFWTPSDHPRLGNCAKGFHNGKPSHAYCMRCPHAKPTGSIPTPGEAVAKAPCSGCGDKTNIAQVKASPAAIEDMLRGG